MSKYQIKIGDQLSCPVCQKSFVSTEDTKYIISGGYTCSWKCFLKRCKEREQEKEVERNKHVSRNH